MPHYFFLLSGSFQNTKNIKMLYINELCHDICYYFKNHTAFYLHIKSYPWYIFLNSTSTFYLVILLAVPISEYILILTPVGFIPSLSLMMSCLISVSGNIMTLPNFFILKLLVKTVVKFIN